MSIYRRKESFPFFISIDQHYNTTQNWQGHTQEKKKMLYASTSQTPNDSMCMGLLNAHVITVIVTFRAAPNCAPKHVFFLFFTSMLRCLGAKQIYVTYPMTLQLYRWACCWMYTLQLITFCRCWANQVAWRIKRERRLCSLFLTQLLLVLGTLKKKSNSTWGLLSVYKRNLLIYLSILPAFLNKRQGRKCVQQQWQKTKHTNAKQAN